MTIFIDADDSWRTDHVATHIKLANSHPGAGIFSSAYIIDGVNVSRNLLTKERQFSANFAKYYFFNRGLICSSSFSCRGKTLKNGLRFSEIRVGEDIQTWLDVVPSYGLAFTQEITNVIHPDFSSNGSSFIIREKPSIAYFSITRSTYWENAVLARRNLLISLRYKRLEMRLLKPVLIVYTALFLEVLRRILLNIANGYRR